MSVDRPHFETGHWCGGCPLATKLHYGCLTDSGGAKVVRLSQPESKVENKSLVQYLAAVARWILSFSKKTGKTV